jgi:hypothetical protein
MSAHAPDNGHPRGTSRDVTGIIKNHSEGAKLVPGKSTVKVSERALRLPLPAANGRGHIREGKSQMSARKEISDEIGQYLGRLIEEDLDRNRDHLKWLEENPEEADRDLQRAESERAIELAGKAQRLFPPPAIEPTEAAEGVAPDPQ